MEIGTAITVNGKIGTIVYIWQSAILVEFIAPPESKYDFIRIWIEVP